jgi:CYTH domain-containing protein
MEIERKWRMLSEPELPARTHTRMSQSYLSVTPELRIRKYEDMTGAKPTTYDLTIKSEGTLAREEIIKSLTAEEYKILLAMIDGREPVVKDHKTFDYEGHVLEYSIVDPERDTGFSYAEIEFPTVEEANSFIAPEWFGEETTEQSTFRMKFYWQETRVNQQ